MSAIASLPCRPGNRTIAIVDDDESVREALANLLLSMGLEVRAFVAAEDFLAWPDRASAACLVSDIQLPGMGGLELQRRLVADGNAPPIILITAFPRDQVRRRGEEQGAVAVLAKPFDCGRLVDCIHRALQPPVSPQAGH